MPAFFNGTGVRTSYVTQRREGECVFWLNCTLVCALTACATVSAADHRLMACGAASKGYVVGMKLPPSGLFALDGDRWEHRGFTHPYITALDYDRRDPRILYMATGNGCIRSDDAGRSWRILTSWDMTELQDVSLDPHHPGTVFIALPDGVGRSTDEGVTWARKEAGIERKYTKAIRVDRAKAGHVVAGTERGIFLSTDNGEHWHLAESAAQMITHIEQSPHDADAWMAATERDGLFRSTDGARTWKNITAALGNATLHRVSYDPRRAGRIAVCGWGPGVLISEDNGASFAARNGGLPSTHIWSVRFDPDHDGRIYASIHEEAVFVSDDAGLHWRRLGMEGTIISSFQFVPEAKE